MAFMAFAGHKADQQGLAGSVMVGLPPSATFTLLIAWPGALRPPGVAARKRSIPMAALVRASKARPRVSGSACQHRRVGGKFER